MRKRDQLCALVLASLTSGAAVPAASDAEVQARLLAGEVVALEILESAGQAADQGANRGAGGGAARMQVLVRAPARDVWAVIVSCELAYRFIAGLRLCEVLEETPGRALVHQVVDQGWLMPRLDFVFESRRNPYDHIEVGLVEGNLNRLEGSWRFTETDSGTLVEHELHVRPAAPVPRFLVRRNLRGSMPDLLACVRALANGSGSEAQRRSDLARCQQ